MLLLCCSLLVLLLHAAPACHRLLSYPLLSSYGILWDGKTETETELKLRMKSYVLLLQKAIHSFRYNIEEHDGRPGLTRGNIFCTMRVEFFNTHASCNKEGVTDYQAVCRQKHLISQRTELFNSVAHESEICKRL